MVLLPARMRIDGASNMALTILSTILSAFVPLWTTFALRPSYLHLLCSSTPTCRSCRVTSASRRSNIRLVSGEQTMWPVNESERPVRWSVWAWVRRKSWALGAG